MNDLFSRTVVGCWMLSRQTTNSFVSRTVLALNGERVQQVCVTEFRTKNIVEVQSIQTEITLLSIYKPRAWENKNSVHVNEDHQKLGGE